MITLQTYLRGYEQLYPSEFTPEVFQNATTTIDRVNLLIKTMQEDGVVIENHPKHGNPVSSGWRPAAVNANVKGAAPRSKHMTAQACDLYDPEGEIDEWCFSHPEVLAAIGLWLEHPSATKGWCHLQVVPPRSGNRFFYP